MPGVPPDRDRPTPIMRLFGATVLRAPRLWLALGLAVTVFFGFHLKDFELDASSDSIVLERDAALAYYDETRQVFGTDDYVFVAFTPPGDLFSPEVRERIGALAAELEAVPGVESVLSLLSVPLFHSPPVPLMSLGSDFRTLLSEDVDIDLARKEIVESPLYSDYLISLDGRTSVIQVNFAPATELLAMYDERNALRARREAGGLAEADAARLAGLEADYRDRHVEYNRGRITTIDAIRAILEREEYSPLGTLYLGGVPMIVADIITYVKRDIIVFGFGVLAFVLLMFGLIFKKAKWVVLPAGACVATVIIMMGYLGYRHWITTIVTSNFSSLLFVVTVSMAIHIVVRFREFHAGNPEASERDLIWWTVRRVSRPCAYTTLTTMVGFASLIVSGIRPVMDFGLMMVGGLAVAYATCFVFLPAALTLFPAGSAPPRRLADLTGSPVAPFATLTERAGWLVAAVSIAAFIFFGIGASKVQVENSFIDYFGERTPIYEGMSVIDDRLGGTTPLEIVLEVENPALIGEDGEPVRDPENGAILPREEFWLSDANLAYVTRVHEFIDAQPETGKVISPHTLIEIIAPIKAGNFFFRNMPMENFLRLVRDQIPEQMAADVLRPYVNDDFTKVRIATRVRESDRGLRRKELLERIDAWLATEGAMDYVNTAGETASVRTETTGMFVLYNNMLQSLFSSQAKTIFMVVGAIWLMFLVLFRSIAIACIAIVPNLLPIVIVLGILGWLGIPLDMMTIMVAAITMGIAVDDTIHYIIRFKSEFAKDRDYPAAMRRCHNSIGRAMFYTTVTIVAGFSIMGFSNFRPTVYFGWLTGVAMIAALLAAVTLLPLLILWIKPLGPPGTAQDSI